MLTGALCSFLPYKIGPLFSAPVVWLNTFPFLFYYILWIRPTGEHDFLLNLTFLYHSKSRLANQYYCQTISYHGLLAGSCKASVWEWVALGSKWWPLGGPFVAGPRFPPYPARSQLDHQASHSFCSQTSALEPRHQNGATLLSLVQLWVCWSSSAQNIIMVVFILYFSHITYVTQKYQIYVAIARCKI